MPVTLTSKTLCSWCREREDAAGSVGYQLCFCMCPAARNSSSTLEHFLASEAMLVNFMWRLGEATVPRYWSNISLNVAVKVFFGEITI